MVKLVQLLRQLNPVKILVVGDIVLDKYTYGKTQRISPEAPVLVVNVNREDYLPGGAGNTALNLISLGADVTLLGRVGDDASGSKLLELLNREGISTSFITIQKGFATSVKNRVLAGNQQIVRVDYEEASSLPAEIEKTLIESIPLLCEQVDAVAISDYGKGFLSESFLQALILHCRARQVPVMTDPKGTVFAKYRGSSLLKPNLSEAYAASGLPSSTSLDTVAAELLKMAQADLLMITRAEAGLSLFDAAGRREDFPAEEKPVKDVTGAGDTVLAMLTFASANRIDYQQAAILCNIAAGIAIERVGCARVSLSDLVLTLIKRNGAYKLFDREHLFVLERVLRDRPFYLLALRSQTALHFTLFEEMRRLGNGGVPLLIYLLEEEVSSSFVKILTSLKEVYFVVVSGGDEFTTIPKLEPAEAYLFDSGKLEQISGENLWQNLSIGSFTLKLNSGS